MKLYAFYCLTSVVCRFRDTETIWRHSPEPRLHSTRSIPDTVAKRRFLWGPLPLHGNRLHGDRQTAIRAGSGAALRFTNSLIRDSDSGRIRESHSFPGSQKPVRPTRSSVRRPQSDSQPVAMAAGYWLVCRLPCVRLPTGQPYCHGNRLLNDVPVALVSDCWPVSHVAIVADLSWLSACLASTYL